MNRDFPENQRSELAELLRQGQKIEAIKVYRQETGSSLKEAKDAVEEMEASLQGKRHPAPATPGLGPPADPFGEKNSRRGCINITVLLTAGAILLVIVFF